MNKKSKPRSKKKTVEVIYDAVVNAQRFGVNKATSNYVARAAFITPQYARRVLREMFEAGVLARRYVRHRQHGWKAEYVTAAYAKRHAEFVLYKNLPK